MGQEFACASVFGAPTIAARHRRTATVVTSGHTLVQRHIVLLGNRNLWVDTSYL